MTQDRENRRVNSGKMARDLADAFETSFKTLLEVTEKSGNLRKDLRNDIIKSVSSLRGAYNTITANLEEKTRKIENLECQMKKLVTLNRRRHLLSRRKDCTQNL